MSEQEHEPELEVSLIKRIEDLANIVQNSSVGEIELTEGGTEVIIKRQSKEERAVAPQQQEQNAQTEIKPPQATAKEKEGIAIAAPLSGVFYASPSPSLPPFVKVGDIIQPEQVIALIEAMKVFNEIRPDVTGRLTRICAETGILVKKGDTLFHIEPVS